MEKENKNNQLSNTGILLDGHTQAMARMVKKNEMLLDELVYKENTNASKGGSPFTQGYTKYSVAGNIFIPIGATQPKLPAGWYAPTYIGNGRYAPALMQVKDEKLIKLADPAYDAVLDDMKKFWEAEEKYRKFSFPYKRGILLYGTPGNGKTGLVHLIADALIKQYNGVLFNIANPDELRPFIQIFNEFRTIEKNRKVVVIMEDVDNFMRYGTSTTTQLLNMLDGNMAFDNIVFLATTNYPDVLLQSLRNRPSRFDRIYEIKSPNEESRRIYIKTKFGDVIDDKEIDTLVEDTNEFTLDMLKELILSIYVLGYNKDEVLQTMRGMFSPMKNLSQDKYNNYNDSTGSVKKFNNSVENTPELKDKKDKFIATKKKP